MTPVDSRPAWSAIREDILRQMWGDGAPIPAIVDRLNLETTGPRITRNAVSAKADRLRLGAHPNVAGKAWAVRRYGGRVAQGREPTPPRRIA